MAKTMDLGAVIAAVKLIHSQSISLGYQCHLTTVGDKFIDPIAVIKTSGRPQGKDYRCLYWVLQGVKYGSNYWLGFINVWERDSSTSLGLKCVRSSPIDFSKCNSIAEVSTVIKEFLEDAYPAISFN
jgi:hypothetical protein